MNNKDDWQSRTRLLLGDEAVERLAAARVLVVGLGGVGGYTAEMLCRSGVGSLTIVDADVVAPSNINRQIIALTNTVDESKAILFAGRLHNINPEADIRARRLYVTPENVGELLEPGFDFVVDAIDTVAPKTALIAHCLVRKIPIVSSMGAGGRIDPTKIVYTDLWDTRDDGLARAVRQRLKKMNLRRSLPVVASTEPPHSAALVAVSEPGKRTSYGTLATVPSIFGIYLANYVIRKITKR